MYTRGDKSPVACGLAAHCVEEHAYLFTVPYETQQMSNLFDSHKEDTLMNDPQIMPFFRTRKQTSSFPGDTIHQARMVSDLPSAGSLKHR
jgi:hypothetical protein